MELSTLAFLLGGPNDGQVVQVPAGMDEFFVAVLDRPYITVAPDEMAMTQVRREAYRRLRSYEVGFMLPNSHHSIYLYTGPNRDLPGR